MRRNKRYYLYRNPTSNTVEVLEECKDHYTPSVGDKWIDIEHMTNDGLPSLTLNAAKLVQYYRTGTSIMNILDFKQQQKQVIDFRVFEASQDD